MALAGSGQATGPEQRSDDAVPAKGRFSRGREVRLRKPGDFRAVFAASATLRSSDGNLTCIAAPNGLQRARLGLAIAKKHVRTAVGRNRVKRAVRESFRLNQSMLRGLDIVVLGRSNTTRATREELRSSAQRHWTRLIRDFARRSVATHHSRD